MACVLSLWMLTLALTSILMTSRCTRTHAVSVSVSAAMFLPGVPIAYYGTEQGMAGGESDNDKRPV